MYTTVKMNVYIVINVNYIYIQITKLQRHLNAFVVKAVLIRKHVVIIAITQLITILHVAHVLFHYVENVVCIMITKKAIIASIILNDNT
jgi:hypothetical protein